MRLRHQQVIDSGVKRNNATNSWVRGLREAEWEAMVQCEVRPCNSNESQSGWQMGGGGMRKGDATTSRTRGTRGHGVMRGNGTMRGGDTGRWEAAV